MFVGPILKALLISLIFVDPNLTALFVTIIIGPNLRALLVLIIVIIVFGASIPLQWPTPPLAAWATTVKR